MGNYYQQHQQVRRDQYNAEGNIYQYRDHRYQHQGDVYHDHGHYGQNVHYHENTARESASSSMLGGCAMILLSLVGVVCFFGGGALIVYGFGEVGAVEMLQGVPRVALGIVGVVLLLVSIAISMYVWIAFPESRNQANFNNYNRYNNFNNYNGYNNYGGRRW